MPATVPTSEEFDSYRTTTGTELDGLRARAVSLEATTLAHGTELDDLRARVASLEAKHQEPTPTPGPEPEPEPEPEPSGPMFAFGLSPARIQALPRSGPEWDRLVAQADAVYEVDHADGRTDGSGAAFCGGLMFVATGNTAYRDKVNAALDVVQSLAPATWWHAAANRKMIGWALAGELVGRPVRNADGSLTAWGGYLREHLSVIHEGGPNRSAIMHHCAHDWDNNHGAAAMASYAAICAVLGLVDEVIDGEPAGLSAVNLWLRGWLGDHQAYGHADSTNPGYGALGITDPPLSRTWQDDPAHPYGVVPATAAEPAKRGAVPSDVFRENAAFPNIGGSADGYVFGNFGRRIQAAVILAAAGYGGLREVGDQAFRRARQWCADNGVNPAGANNQAYDAIVNAWYGTAFPAVPGASEGIGAADWLALDGAWPPRT